MKELEELIERLEVIPELPPLAPKNFFDITGIRSKEVINSKVLSYFFNVNEEHGFGTLFYNALVEIIDRKKAGHLPPIDLSHFSGEFLIEEEEPTHTVAEQEKKRIDLLLKGENWAIIIENKLYHDVINPLATYWEHVYDKQHKIGIILSLFKVSVNKCIVPGKNLTYINITHDELITEVSKKFVFTSNYNETSLFYLKEYFKTIETHYTAKINTPVMNEIVNKLIMHRDNVNKLMTKVGEAEKFLETCVASALSEYGYELSGTVYLSPTVSGLQIVPKTNKLLSENRLVIYFAVMIGDNSAENIEAQKNHLKSRIDSLGKYFRPFKDDKIFAHFVCYDNPNFLGPGEDFDSKFRLLLKECYFNEDGLVKRINTSNFLKKK